MWGRASSSKFRHCFWWQLYHTKSTLLTALYCLSENTCDAGDRGSWLISIGGSPWAISMSNVENVCPQVLRGVARELRRLAANPPAGIKLVLRDEDLTDVVAHIDGPGKVIQTYCCMFVIIKWCYYSRGKTIIKWWWYCS